MQLVPLWRRLIAVWFYVEGRKLKKLDQKPSWDYQGTLDGGLISSAIIAWIVGFPAMAAGILVFRFVILLPLVVYRYKVDDDGLT